MTSWLDALATFLVSLGTKIAAVVRGEPVPEPAATKPPDGMTANEQAARKQAEADAAAAKVGK